MGVWGLAPILICNSSGTLRKIKMPDFGIFIFLKLVCLNCYIFQNLFLIFFEKKIDIWLFLVYNFSVYFVETVSVSHEVLKIWGVTSMILKTSINLMICGNISL